MKLLLIFILFLLFFILGSGMNRELREDITVIESLPEQQEMLITDNLSVSENYNWLDSYFRMLDVLASVKQLNLLQDQTGHSHHQGREWYDYRDSSMGGCTQSLYASKFMRLLSARHVNGFYIYSLEKLII